MATSDPKECRIFAARCAELAAVVRKEQLKEQFLNLSKTWDLIALQLERRESLMLMMSDQELMMFDQEKASKMRPLKYH